MQELHAVFFNVSRNLTRLFFGDFAHWAGLLLYIPVFNGQHLAP